MAYQEGERAKQTDNPGVRQIVTDSARHCRGLAVKLERHAARAPQLVIYKHKTHRCAECRSGFDGFRCNL